MKKCPFCAEEIQDAAIVCKHCGRDLKGGASQVQIVQAKKKTSFATWLVAGLLGLLFVGWCSSPMNTTNAPAKPQQTMNVKVAWNAVALQITNVSTPAVGAPLRK